MEKNSTQPIYCYQVSWIIFFYHSLNSFWNMKMTFLTSMISVSMAQLKIAKIFSVERMLSKLHPHVFHSFHLESRPRTSRAEFATISTAVLQTNEVLFKITIFMTTHEKSYANAVPLRSFAFSSL